MKHLIPFLGVIVSLTGPIFGQDTPYSAMIKADQPAGYWRLNERSGPIALDSSGNARHGTYLGGVTLGQPGNTGDTSPQFDGSTGYVSLPGAWGGVSALTVEAWVYLDQPRNDFQSILGELTGTGFAHLQFNSAFGNNAVYTDAGFLGLPLFPQLTGGWHHFAITAKNGFTQDYVDGLPFLGADNTLFTTILTSSTLRIASGVVSGRFLGGRISDVAIYYRSLSPDRITAHAQQLDPFGTGGNPYQVRYAANLTSGIDSLINIINAGGNGNVPVNGPGFGANNGGNICVNVYTLDPNEELLNCCSCLLTPNQVVNLKVQANLMANTLTGFPTPAATIKIIGSTGATTPAAAAATTCANESAQVRLGGGTHNVTGGFVAFGATPHSTTGGQFAVTETPFISATLSPSELTSLTTRCAAILGNASGAGVCSGCANGALGAARR